MMERLNRNQFNEDIEFLHFSKNLQIRNTKGYSPQVPGRVSSPPGAPLTGTMLQAFPPPNVCGGGSPLSRGYA